MGFANIVWSFFTGALLEYETQKVVQIHSKKVGASFRLIQLFFVLYVILWVMVKEKGYQKFDKAQSGVTAKLKGIAFANLTDNPNIGATIFDAADYVIPPQQRAAFFVMTNLIVTPGQSLGRCEESHDVYGNNCTRNTDCTAGKLVLVGSGVQTGRCIPSTRDKGLNVCEIYGWCPTEYDIMPKVNILESAPDFTVILKNSIEFPNFKVKRRNILSWMNKQFLRTCRYNPDDAKKKYCPIFRLGDIINYTKADNKDVWRFGGMVSIHIKWDCNLDYSEEDCVPNYTFRRLDDFASPVGKGWNFRFSHHYVENGMHKRNLIKAYGIQFFISVYGNGGRFDMLVFTMNLGSGLALLGIATVVCDMIILNVTRKRNVYRNAKVDLVVRRKRRELCRQMGRKRQRTTHDAELNKKGQGKANPSENAEINATKKTVKNTELNPTVTTETQVISEVTPSEVCVNGELEKTTRATSILEEATNCTDPNISPSPDLINLNHAGAKSKLDQDVKMSCLSEVFSCEHEKRGDNANLYEKAPNKWQTTSGQLKQRRLSKALTTAGVVCDRNKPHLDRQRTVELGMLSKPQLSIDHAVPADDGISEVNRSSDVLSKTAKPANGKGNSLESRNKRYGTKQSAVRNMPPNLKISKSKSGGCITHHETEANFDYRATGAQTSSSAPRGQGQTPRDGMTSGTGSNKLTSNVFNTKTPHSQTVDTIINIPPKLACARPDAGLYTGVPQSVINSLLPPTPKKSIDSGVVKYK